ncbi:hypothetical protein M5K25_016913 [Dendrobium thyrsiflorum]|uniref:Uncharacterized protein n=1 Tax=Dendrobium thyrsiflorum TaxID=117978 RepID=A0ABD0UT54_DENTH
MVSFSVRQRHQAIIPLVQNLQFLGHLDALDELMLSSSGSEVFCVFPHIPPLQDQANSILSLPGSSKFTLFCLSLITVQIQAQKYTLLKL